MSHYFWSLSLVRSHFSILSFHFFRFHMFCISFLTFLYCFCFIIICIHIVFSRISLSPWSPSLVHSVLPRRSSALCLTSFSPFSSLLFYLLCRFSVCVFTSSVLTARATRSPYLILIHSFSIICSSSYNISSFPSSSLSLSNTCCFHFHHLRSCPSFPYIIFLFFCFIDLFLSLSKFIG